MDPNWIIAIISIISVISPTISTCISYFYQMKIKQLELFEKNRYSAIENFTKSVEEYYHHRTSSSTRIAFESSISNLFIYFSIPNYSLFDKLKECISENDFNKTQFAVSEIVRYLSSQLKK